MSADVFSILSRCQEIIPGMFDAASDLVLVTNWKRTIIYANRVTAEKTGYPLDELIGKKISLLYPRLCRARYISTIEAVLRKHHHWSGELEVQRKDQTRFWVEARLEYYYNEERIPQGSIAILKDITDQRLLGRYVWDSENRLHAVIESMEDALYVCDPKGKISLVNDAFCQMLGYSKDEIFGMPFPYPWLRETKVSEFRAVEKTIRKKERIRNYPATWYRKDRTPIVVSMAISLLRNPEQNVAGYVITARNVTDMRLADELRRAQDQIQWLMADVRKKAERLTTLQATNQLVLQNAGLDQVFKVIVTGMRRLVEHDLAGIYLLDPAKKQLRAHILSKQTAFTRKLAQFPLRLGEGIVGSAARSGKAVCVNNAQLDPRSTYPAGMKPETEHVVAVPLRVRKSVFGVLIVARNRGPEFIEEEVAVVQSFANAAMVALENALLSEQSKYHGISPVTPDWKGQTHPRSK